VGLVEADLGRGVPPAAAQRRGRLASSSSDPTEKSAGPEGHPPQPSALSFQLRLFLRRPPPRHPALGARRQALGAVCHLQNPLASRLALGLASNGRFPTTHPFDHQRLAASDDPVDAAAAFTFAIVANCLQARHRAWCNREPLGHGEVGTILSQSQLGQAGSPGVGDRLLLDRGPGLTGSPPSPRHPATRKSAGRAREAGEPMSRKGEYSEGD
jgi:hypothetical protein